MAKHCRARSSEEIDSLRRGNASHGLRYSTNRSDPVGRRSKIRPASADQVAVIEVESSERVHTNVKDETYLRVGDENRRLGALEAQELRYDKGESAFDGSAGCQRRSGFNKSFRAFSMSMDGSVSVPMFQRG